MTKENICKFYPGCPFIDLCRQSLGGPNLNDDDCLVAQYVLETGEGLPVTTVLEEVSAQQN